MPYFILLHIYSEEMVVEPYICIIHFVAEYRRCQNSSKKIRPTLWYNTQLYCVRILKRAVYIVIRLFETQINCNLHICLTIFCTLQKTKKSYQTIYLDEKCWDRIVFFTWMLRIACNFHKSDERWRDTTVGNVFKSPNIIYPSRY